MCGEWLRADKRKQLREHVSDGGWGRQAAKEAVAMERTAEIAGILALEPTGKELDCRVGEGSSVTPQDEG